MDEATARFIEKYDNDRKDAALAMIGEAVSLLETELFGEGQLLKLIIVEPKAYRKRAAYTVHTYLSGVAIEDEEEDGYE